MTTTDHRELSNLHGNAASNHRSHEGSTDVVSVATSVSHTLPPGGAIDYNIRGICGGAGDSRNKPQLTLLYCILKHIGQLNKIQITQMIQKCNLKIRSKSNIASCVIMKFVSNSIYILKKACLADGQHFFVV